MHHKLILLEHIYCDGCRITSADGESNRGMGGPFASVNAIKCPRYEIRSKLSNSRSIVGISFYRKSAELQRFQRIYNHLSSGKPLKHSTRAGIGWKESFF